MLQIPNDFKDELEAMTVNPDSLILIYFFEIGFDTPVYYTDYEIDLDRDVDGETITFRSATNYLISHGIGGNSPVDGTPEVQLAFLDLNQDIIDSFDGKFVGVPLKIWLQVNSQPLNRVGTLFSKNFATRLQNGQLVASATFTGRFNLIRGYRSMLLNENWLKQLDSTDTAFEFINADRTPPRWGSSSGESKPVASNPGSNNFYGRGTRRF